MLKIMKEFFDFCGEENRKKFFDSIMLSVIQAIFGALRIPAIAILLNAALSGHVTTREILLSFTVMVISVIGIGIVKGKASILQTEGGYGACAEKRIEIAKHMRFLPMGYFNQNSIGSITSVTTNTMQGLENVATRVVMLVCEGLLTTAMIAVMLLLFDWRIALILMAGFAAFLLVNSRLQAASEKISAQKMETDEKMVEQVLEYIQGITEVKTFHLIGEKTKALNRSIRRNAAVNTKMEFTLIPYMGLQLLLTKLTGLAMASASVMFYLNGTMSLYLCIVMIIASFLVLDSLSTAGNYSALLRVVNLSVALADQILRTETMDIDGQSIKPASYDLHAEHIDFSYEEKKIIHDVTFDIPEKTTTAIVGPSGGGKTTLTNLLARFWDVDAGSITLGGRNVKDYSMDSLMENFSFVFQNVYLFHDTIANNIRFSNPEASMDEVIAAAKKACCHDFITKLPNGYDTVLGDDGVSLSGGEKQRVSIARAIMKDAPIIILDEATANVDPESEAELISAIEELTREKTIIMIAHRLKTVRNADQILVIDQGSIVQKGRHDELIRQEGIYRSFVREREKAVGWKLA
ncbi:MAG: ABC transporter ATP-binding protein [Lachnospiraceae bacterium]|nr:ABC transporter ATP-binding protein [Lachnospiraceae bacterium]